MVLLEVPFKEDKMKSQDKQKNEEKKKPQKTLKEKRAEKKAKKSKKGKTKPVEPDPEDEDQTSDEPDEGGDEPPPADEVRVPLIVQPEGVLLVPHNASRLDRFRAARIADPEPFVPGRPYRYRIVPSSLAWAREQDIGPEQMLGFLESAGGRPVPASVRRGITRWAERGVEGRLQSVVVVNQVIHVHSPLNHNLATDD